MMEIIDVIRERRSVRKYESRVPDDRDIEKVLEAGRWAPSGLNNQPWKFTVIKEKSQRDALADFTKYGQIIKSAPVCICVFLDNGSTYNRDKDLMAIGACIQNMALAAYALGLGTCWLGEILNRKEELCRYLDVDSDLELAAVLTLGYPGEDIKKGSRKPVKSFLITINSF